MINGIEQYFSTVADKENYFFYQGKKWNGSQWVYNLEGIKLDSSSPLDSVNIPFTVATDDVNMPRHSIVTLSLLSEKTSLFLMNRSMSDSLDAYIIAVNVQTWSICLLQPIIIDKIFGETGAALKMWNNLKETCGRFDNEGELQGFGYTNIKSSYDQGMGRVISTECTFSAMMACKVLKEYYGEMADTEPYSVSVDLAEMEAFIYIYSKDKVRRYPSSMCFE